MVACFSFRRTILGLGAFVTLVAIAHSLSAWDMSGLWARPPGGGGPGNGWNDNPYIEYTTVTGFFLQDEASTDADTFDYSTTNFGLINRAYSTDKTLPDAASKTQWQRFAHYVDTLNAVSDRRTTQYKVLIMGRHGEGIHNAAESYYGTPAWNCYWAQLDGNGTVVWADAHLTDNGVAQAKKANQFWRSQLADQKQPAPQRYYTSPLTRCLQTASLTFDGLDLPRDQPFIPTIKEKLREDISTHTCDRRSNKTYIHESFPTFRFEKGFTEYDELWNGVTAETDDANDVRSRALLDDIFSHDDSTWLSFTSHSGDLGSVLRVLGHRQFDLSTGAIIPVLVRAYVLRNETTPTTTYAWEAESTCTSPPVTSLDDGGCVCSSTTGLATSATSAPSSS